MKKLFVIALVTLSGYCFAQQQNTEITKLEGLQKLMSMRSDGVLVVNFWATWCAPCRKEFPEFETMYRMYGKRNFDLVTVSINYPDEQPGVLKALTAEHATSTNLIMGSTDIYANLAAFDPKWNAAVPYTLLISASGEILYQSQGTADMTKLRRLIISNLADDDYIGHGAYWKASLAPAK